MTPKLRGKASPGEPFPRQNEGDAPEPSPGRPRDPSIDERVVAATRELLAELGWDAMSVRGIAERSGVSRAAIHRRWPSKAHLVLDAVLGAVPALDRFDGVDRSGWVHEVVAGSFELFDRPEVRDAVPGLLAAIRAHEDLRATLWPAFSGPAAEIYLALAPKPAGRRDRRGHDVEANAVIALAAGAALVLSLLAADEDTPALRRTIEEMLQRGALRSKAE